MATRLDDAVLEVRIDSRKAERGRRVQERKQKAERGREQRKDVRTLERQQRDRVPARRALSARKGLTALGVAGAVLTGAAAGFALSAAVGKIEDKIFDLLPDLVARLTDESTGLALKKLLGESFIAAQQQREAGIAGIKAFGDVPELASLIFQQQKRLGRVSENAAIVAAVDNVQFNIQQKAADKLIERLNRTFFESKFTKSQTSFRVEVTGRIALEGIRAVWNRALGR